MAIDLFTDDLSGVTNDELYSAIKSFAEANPSEGWRHDFTSVWCDSALRKAAAFANTFGGLLFVGIQKNKGDRDCKLLGVDSPTEYKTRIASSMAANISPTPNYDVHECADPTGPDRRYCIVRVRPGKVVHLVTKKGLDPVFVRNEDEARPPDASQLRRLIDRERQMAPGDRGASQRAQRLAGALPVCSGFENDDPAVWIYSPRHQSDTFLRLMLEPSEVFCFEMERTHENRLLSIIHELYPRVRNLAAQGKANDAERRGAEFYQYAWYHKSLNYEQIWHATGDGALGHGTQMAYKDPQKAVWSVVDLAMYVILFLKLGMRWWKAVGYFGEGSLYTQLSVRGLTLLRNDASGTFGSCFDPTYEVNSGPARKTIRPDSILVSGRSGESANAEIKVNYFIATEGLPRLATSLLNTLLRSLGHAAVWGPLEESVGLLAES